MLLIVGIIYIIQISEKMCSADLGIIRYKRRDFKYVIKKLEFQKHIIEEGNLIGHRSLKPQNIG